MGTMGELEDGRRERLQPSSLSRICVCACPCEWFQGKHINTHIHTLSHLGTRHRKLPHAPSSVLRIVYCPESVFVCFERCETDST